MKVGTCWDRLLWGIAFTGGMKGDKPRLIGRGWNSDLTPQYEQEPSRALLYCTRKDARDYCDNQHAKYAARTDLCAKWRFRPVRVRERVTQADRGAK